MQQDPRKSAKSLLTYLTVVLQSDGVVITRDFSCEKRIFENLVALRSQKLPKVAKSANVH